MKFIDRIKFRDFLGLIGQAEIIILWILQGAGVIHQLPENVNGALIVIFTLIFQFYFRKKPKESQTGK